jgi:cysteinyl-tRNA synthetase
MDLRLYDTLTREKRTFVPIDPNNVRMYVCGPTVYDFAHIGNARPVIVFDVLFRLLRHLAKQGVWDGGKGETKVTYVRNITDVDDKINARAAERLAARGEVDADLNAEIRVITEQTYRDFQDDVRALGALVPEDVNHSGEPPRFVEPRATEHIAEMKYLIERLIASDNAYVAQQHVLFNVPSMPDYGKLSKQPLDDMIAGARIDVAPYKRDAMDFVLWKPSKPGEPSWPSPAGIEAPGRPGWHIECSAMAWKHLGEQFDIHGGGIDLVFPHHENELAQSCCAFHEDRMANVWMHNAFLEVEGEKMSKSLGNFVTINEMLHTNKFGGRRWPGEVLRLAMLKTHYRQPIDWTVKSLLEAEQILTDWQRLVSHVAVEQVTIRPTPKLERSLSDDLNVSEVFVELHELAKLSLGNVWQREKLYANLVFLGLLPDRLQIAKRLAAEIENEAKLPKDAGYHVVEARRPQIEKALRRVFKTLPPSANTAATIATAYSTLKLGPMPYGFLDHWTKHNPYHLAVADVEHIEQIGGIDNLNLRIEERLEARARRDFKRSDEIRGELTSEGIDLDDHKDRPTTWKRKR